MVRIGDDVKLAKPTDGKRGSYEVATNNDNPLVLTLRNTARLLMAKAEYGENPVSDSTGAPVGKWAVISKALKAGAVALGGLAALTVAKDAAASSSTGGSSGDIDGFQKPEDALNKDAIIDAATSTKEQVLLTIEDEAPTLEKDVQAPASGPATDKTTAPRTKKSDSMLSDSIGYSSSAESVDSAINRAAKDSGEDPKQLRAMIHLESKGDPRAKSGQYLGLGQIGKAAWQDVKSECNLKLPELTNDADDPRFDPYTNALVTAKLMGLNRKRISKAAKAAGYKTVTLGLLYSAHNVGVGTTNKILAEKDSSKWDETTKKYIGNQAKELTAGGLENYLSNAERSMKGHYEAANVAVGSAQVAQAQNIGVMSSVSPSQLPASQRVESAVRVAEIPAATNVPIKVSAYVPKKERVAVVRAAPQEQQGVTPRRQQKTEQVASAEAQEPFRLRNGKLAAV